VTAPILIIGGGLAGLFCALKLAPRPVTILSTAPIGTGASSVWAQGGIAAALSDGDTPEKHTHDTMVAGAGIVDEAQVLSMAQEARARIYDLLSYGVPFDRDLEGKLVQSREAAHSERRIVRVKGDTAGKAIMEALHIAVTQAPSIEVIAGLTAQELVCVDGRVTGILVENKEGALVTYSASAIVLATGGIGHLFEVTTNPVESRGIGLAIAARAGAVIADAEFVQFHPTAIDVGRDPAPLATEALRGDGATLLNASGTRFMLDVHPDAELAPRDIVARAVFAEIQAGRKAFLDCRTAIGTAFKDKFPTVYAICMSAGIDPATSLIPILPAEHYHMGGIETDARGRTSLQGLWAAGEVASTGVHGANRLASNSLLEAVVFAARIAEDIGALDFPEVRPGKSMSDADSLKESEGLEMELRHTMAQHVGVMRNHAGLVSSLKKIAQIQKYAKTLSLKNMATSCLMIAAAALVRLESRGGHFRTDYPLPVPSLAKRSRFTLAEAHKIAEDAK
jgi:L-aspartate oxidase